MIARRAGTVVSLGMLLGMVAGCGTQLDPRLQSNAELRDRCAFNGTASDEQIRGILAEIEARRLQGSTIQDEFDSYEAKCEQQYQTSDDRGTCENCRSACIKQVYGVF